MFKGKGGLMSLVLSVLGIVLFVTMFATILDSLVTLVGTGVTILNYTILSTCIKIAPVVLMVSIPAVLGVTAYKGYSRVSESDAGGLMRIIMGVLWIILFIAMFSTILTGFETVRAHANITYFIALSTVTVIMPTIIFLGGLFSGGLVAVAGIKQSFRKNRGGAGI
jgi:hypothetical protein